MDGLRGEVSEDLLGHLATLTLDVTSSGGGRQQDEIVVAHRPLVSANPGFDQFCREQ